MMHRQSAFSLERPRRLQGSAVTVHADFASQEYFRNPPAEIERLRAAGPVVEVRFPLVGTVWTTTQDLANQVLRDSQTFTLRGDDGNVVGLQWWMPKIVRAIANNMLSADEPDHTRLRGVVDEAFRRQAVLEMQPRILAIAGELANELFVDGSPADLVDRHARRLPLSLAENSGRGRWFIRLTICDMRTNIEPGGLRINSLRSPRREILLAC